MTGLTQISEHVQKLVVHQTKALCKEVFVDGLGAEVEVPGVPVIGDAVPLNAITQPLKLTTTSLVLRLPLHLSRLLVHREVLSQQPRLLPNVPQPPEELINLEVWTLLFRWWSHQRILACEEMLERTVLLLVARPDGRRDLVVAVCRLLRLRLHLLGELRTWCKPVDDVDAKHRNNVPVREGHVLAGEDVALFPCIVQYPLVFE